MINSGNSRSAGNLLQTAAVWLSRLVVAATATCGCLLSIEPARADDVRDLRRTEIENMDQAAKDNLRRNYEWFVGLTTDEQDRLRALHQHIEEQPDSEALQELLGRYCEWLQTLSPKQQAELKDMPIDERIAKIREFVKGPQGQGFGREGGRSSFGGGYGMWRPGVMEGLPPEDEELIARWIREVAPKYKERFMASLSDEDRQKLERDLDDPDNSPPEDEVWGQMWLRWQAMNQGKIPPSAEEDLKAILSQLSSATQEKLAEMPDDKRQQTVSRWIRFLVVKQYYFQRSGVSPRAFTKDELARYFENELDPEVRETLLSLPAEEMQRQWTYRYLQSKMPDVLPSPDLWMQRHGPGQFRGPGTGRGGPQYPRGPRGPGGGRPEGGQDRPGFMAPRGPGGGNGNKPADRPQGPGS